MPYEPDIDNIADEDEDIKIWRGAVKGDGAEDFAPAEDARRGGRSQGRHAGRTPAEKRKDGKAPQGTKIKLLSKIFTYINRKDLMTAAVSLLLLAGVGLLPLDGWKKTLLYLLPVAAAGFETALEAGKNVLNVKMLERANMVFLAAVICFCIGEYTAAVMVFVLFILCRSIDGFALKKEREALSQIRGLSAQRAKVETINGFQTVGPEYVELGDIILIMPGERISHDGIVAEGISAVDISPLTGTAETKPVNKGHKVCAGCINVTAPIKVEVTRRYEQSTSFSVAELIRDASDDISAEEKMIFRVGRYFTPICFVLALACGALMPVLLNQEWTRWLRRAAVLLVISGTASVTISVPLAYFASLVSAAKKGILIKSAETLSRFAKTDTVVLDKTGAVTEGVYEIKEVFPVNISEDQLLSIAATAETNSMHPIAQALKSAGENLKVDVLTAEEIPGRGVSAFINGRHACVGNAALLEEHNVKHAVPSRPGAAVHVSLDGRYCGHIIVSDRVRAGTLEALDRLRTQGVKKLVMLTGDVLSVARPIANKLNFDMLRAELLPEDKAAAVYYLTDNCPPDKAMVFVGDAVTDAEAMGKADIGVAINCLGEDAALKNADIAIMDGEIRKLPLAMQISIQAKRITLENILASVAVKAVVLLLALTGELPVLTAVLLDGICFAALIFNSLRAFKDWDVINYIQRVLF